jgi:type I restriction-modification system DNA methylase subunit
MHPSIDFKKLENSFRQHGVEGEGVFYSISAIYLEHYVSIANDKLNKTRMKGLGILKRIEDDTILINTIKKLVKSDPNGEYLPNIYQYYLSKRFRGSTGKFFTPRPIASAMASLVPLIKNAVIMDPTCGGGTFLVEASKRWKNLHCHLIGNDIDETLIDLSELVLSLSTPPHHKKTLVVSNIYQPNNEIKTLFGGVDYILANPPFSLEIEIFENKSKLFSLGYKNSDALFLDLAYKLLKPGGRLICLLPHSIVSNKEYEPLRKTIEEDWYILGVIILPEGVFHFTSNTTTRADIVILMKKDPKLIPTKAIFCNAPSVGIPLNSKKLKSNENELWRIISNNAITEALNLNDEGKE